MADCRETIPLVETVLLGAAQEHGPVSSLHFEALGIPSPAELANEYDLARAKAYFAPRTGLQVQRRVGTGASSSSTPYRALWQRKRLST